MSSSSLSTTSSEFGTDGNYAKCWVREDGDIYLYKTGSRQDEVEPLSEFFATQLAQVLCPVVDNNRSLFPDLDQEQLENPDWYLSKCRPKLGRDFVVTARGLLTPEIREKLKNLIGFQFRQHERINAPQEWLGTLSEIVNQKVCEILK